MSEVDRAAPRSRRSWLYLLLLAVVAAPVALALYDWSQAVRSARNAASALAWRKATRDFLGQEWDRGRSVEATATLVESPPRTGAFAGYSYATHVEAVYEWRPIFHPLIGGPYLIRSQATAAIVRDESGKWMPMLVE